MNLVSDMAQKYWSMYFDLKISEYYYQLYAIHSSRQKMILSFLCALGSAACVVSWYQSGVAPLLWASLILVAQIIAVAQPYLPFDKRLIAANYIHSDIAWLVLKVEDTWNTFSEDTEEEVFSEKISFFSAEWQKIEERFADASTFPENRRLHNKAENSAKTYFRRYCR